MKFAIIENEFGEIGIDGDLVAKEAREFQAEEIISMDNGCLCCTIRDDLVKGVRALLTKEVKFDGIIIETTGMADPAPVVQTFYQNDDLRRRCRVDGVITVIDCKHVNQHLYVKPEKEEDQDEVVNECMQQVGGSRNGGEVGDVDVVYYCASSSAGSREKRGKTQIVDLFMGLLRFW